MVVNTAGRSGLLLKSTSFQKKSREFGSLLPKYLVLKSLSLICDVMSNCPRDVHSFPKSNFREASICRGFSGGVATEDENLGCIQNLLNESCLIWFGEILLRSQEVCDYWRSLKTLW